MTLHFPIFVLLLVLFSGYYPLNARPPLPSPAAIEACLGHLLKRRAAGFLRSDKIAALFTKVGKVFDTAGEICRKVQDQLQQQADLTRLVFPPSLLYVL